MMLSVYGLNETSKYMKQQLTQLKQEIGKSTIMAVKTSMLS